MPLIKATEDKSEQHSKIELYQSFLKFELRTATHPNSPNTVPILEFEFQSATYTNPNNTLSPVTEQDQIDLEINFQMARTSSLNTALAGPKIYFLNSFLASFFASLFFSSSFSFFRWASNFRTFSHVLQSFSFHDSPAAVATFELMCFALFLLDVPGTVLSVLGAMVGRSAGPMLHWWRHFGEQCVGG